MRAVLLLTIGIAALAAACGTGDDRGAQIANAVSEVPSSLILTVKETAGVARNGEVVRSGVPFPRSLNITGTNGLTVVDGAGLAVPADFRVLARWNAGKSSIAPIQWLLVSFPATVAANSSAT